MLNSIKKALLFGLGSFDYSKEKLTETVNEFMDNEKIDRKEGRKLVDEVLKKAEKQKKTHEKYLRGLVKDILGELEVATKKDLKTIQNMETTKVVKDMIKSKVKSKPAKKAAPKKVVKKKATKTPAPKAKK